MVFFREDRASSELASLLALDGLINFVSKEGVATFGAYKEVKVVFFANRSSVLLFVTT